MRYSRLHNDMRTQVAIVGGGPAGLLLAHLLHLHSVESVLIERASREHCEGRVRAGVLEQSSVDALTNAGLGARIARDGIVHTGIELRFNRRAHRIDFRELTGRAITVYGQSEVVKDLIQARLKAGGEPIFEVENVTLRSLDSSTPTVRYQKYGASGEIVCDFIAGCDGRHGVSRRSIPVEAVANYERVYPVAWLGILAEASPPSKELIYANHDRGFALASMRSPTLSRLYLQCDPAEQLEEWPDDRIREELQTRLQTDDGFRLNDGPIIQKNVTSMRSLVVEPMQYGRLFLAGDAAHVVPPTGAKGMNLAMADARILSLALADFYATGRRELLDRYSQTCLRRVWHAQHFSYWMTSLFHRFDGDAGFDHRRQLAELEYVVSSRSASQSLAESYVGLLWE